MFRNAPSLFRFGAQNFSHLCFWRSLFTALQNWIVWNCSYSGLSFLSSAGLLPFALPAAISSSSNFFAGLLWIWGFPWLFLLDREPWRRRRVVLLRHPQNGSTPCVSKLLFCNFSDCCKSLFLGTPERALHWPKLPRESWSKKGG